jgi:hypothetical protein
MMNTITDTQVKKPRGRPAKTTTSNTSAASLTKTQPTSSDLKQYSIELEISEGKKRGRPLKSTQPKQPTPAKIAEARTQEKELEKQEYKSEMQKYLKERLRQGKAKLKLDESIKKLETRLKSI